MHGFKYDNHLKTFLKMGKPLEEAFDSNPLKEQLEEVTEAMTAEKVKPPLGAEEIFTGSDDEADKKGVQDGSDGLKIADPTMQPKTADHKDKHDQWETFARRLIKEGVRVISQGNATESQLAEILKSSAAGKIRGDPGMQQYAVIIYDIKNSGESITAPHERMPPFRNSHMTKMLSAVFKARDKLDELDDGDVFFCFDAFRHGNE